LRQGGGPLGRRQDQFGEPQRVDVGSPEFGHDASVAEHERTIHDMGQLLDRAYETFRDEARRRSIDYRRDVRDRPVITSDGDRVLQIVSNLLANALHWTPSGGRVDLELSRRDGEVMVAVADTGPGIAPQEQERIFRPFWSADGSGTGLGLTIARELALALGGRLELESTPGRGSRFVLVLPVKTQPA